MFNISQSIKFAKIIINKAYSFLKIKYIFAVSKNKRNISDI